MTSAFSLALYPWTFVARSDGNGGWRGTYHERHHLSPAEESALPPAELEALMAERNWIPGLPLVNYTTQYGLGCFEGLKAFPQPDGALKLFRPDQNAIRMHRSMVGLKMPGIPEDLFVTACKTVVARNAALGFTVPYDAAWQAGGFASARAVYVRPFAYSEPGIGLNLSTQPGMVIATTPVGSYFDPKASRKAITTEKVRATPGGTGWIKCNANYVIPILTKFEVQARGFMEVIFLDARTQRYVEEGSSCNVFFRMADGALVTPELEDTILPGITRGSIIQLARDRGVTVTERRLSIDEVMRESVEAFVTGTAAGVTPIESLTHDGVERVFGDRSPGELTRALVTELKGIQYGSVPDRHGWMVAVGDG